MMSNNGSMTYKNKYLSFINKGVGAFYVIISMIVLVPCVYLMFAYWSEMPMVIKIMGPSISIIIFVAVLIMPFNGMSITKNGTILFAPDFRLKILNVKDLEKIAIIFNEWGNNKYSASLKFVYKGGKVFIKDYSKQFRNMKNKKLTMSMYTITKRKVDRICNKLLDLEVCVITILDKNRNITYQSK